MNAKVLFNTLVEKIKVPEPIEEIKSIAFLVLENLYQISRIQILSQQEIQHTKESLLETIVLRINQHEPIQYILGEAHFFGRCFYVDKNVLIPRPETEQLTSLVLDECRNKKNQLKLLDIGTGSGCVPITLAKELVAEVHAVDISDEALRVASINAERHQANVHFHQLDILHESIRDQNFSAIVSNPPYITISEKEEMKSNVVDYEPHLALFVPDDDPLLFYRAIANRTMTALADKGKVFLEINKDLGPEVAALFKDHGFKAQIVKDMFDKDRFVIASK